MWSERLPRARNNKWLCFTPHNSTLEFEGAQRRHAAETRTHTRQTSLRGLKPSELPLVAAFALSVRVGGAEGVSRPFLVCDVADNGFARVRSGFAEAAAAAAALHRLCLCLDVEVDAGRDLEPEPLRDSLSGRGGQRQWVV